MNAARIVATLLGGLVAGAAAHAQAQSQPLDVAPAVVVAPQPVGAPAVQVGPELGRVLSSVPVIQQVAVPRQVCSSQPVLVEQQPSGAGALIGAIAGGALGNAVGGGSGRAAATVFGAFGGAILGNHIEGGGARTQNQTTCTTQTTYENRAVGYDVTYEYAGRQYRVQLPQDPGPTVRVQVVPVGAAAPATPAVVQPAPVAPPLAQAPVVIVREVVTVPPPVVYAPQPYLYPQPLHHARPWYPPVSLHLGYVYQGGRRHWR